MSALNYGPNVLKQFINNSFHDKEPWQIVSITMTSVLTCVWLWNFLNQDESLTSRTKKMAFRLCRKIPYISKKIDAELGKITDKFDKDAEERFKSLPFFTNLPSDGMKEEEIMNLIKDYLSIGKFHWKEGFVSGAVYFDPENMLNLLSKVYATTSYTNPLHPEVFPGICKMEAEVVRISANLFHGGPESCGCMTTGGTESILMACKAFRDYGKNVKGIKKPRMVIPRTAHPAFEKSAKYLGISIYYVSTDPITTCVSISEMEKAINRNTIMLVGSVPTYPYGVMDDIKSIASLGVKYDIPVHVDCCLGGFLLAFMPEAGFELPPFDFRVPGVTSISADTHKYAYCPKGSSIILYSHPKYRHEQYCITTDWPGGIYGSPTVAGSRPGGVIATCWATLMHLGKNEYIKATKRVIESTKYIEEELRKVNGIFIFGKPVTSVIAVGSNDFHVFCLVEKLNDKGWSVNPLQFPHGFHICVTHVHTQDGVAKRFVDDVKEAVTEILKDPKMDVQGKMAMYGMSQSIPDRSIVGDFTRFFLDTMYYTPKSVVTSTLNGIKNQ